MITLINTQITQIKIGVITGAICVIVFKGIKKSKSYIIVYNKLNISALKIMFTTITS